jgi:hypothetical protein
LALNIVFLTCSHYAGKLAAAESVVRLAKNVQTDIPLHIMLGEVGNGIGMIE